MLHFLVFGFNGSILCKLYKRTFINRIIHILVGYQIIIVSNSPDEFFFVCHKHFVSMIVLHIVLSSVGVAYYANYIACGQKMHSFISLQPASRLRIGCKHEFSNTNIIISKSRNLR